MDFESISSKFGGLSEYHPPIQCHHAFHFGLNSMGVVSMKQQPLKREPTNPFCFLGYNF